jgi:hypothetical protein
MWVIWDQKVGGLNSLKREEGGFENIKYRS